MLALLPLNLVPPGGYTATPLPVTGAVIKSWMPYILGACAVGALGFLLLRRRSSSTVNGFRNCTVSEPGKPFVVSCWGDKGTVSGRIDPALGRTCGQIRGFSHHGIPLVDKRECFFKEDKAREFVRSEVGKIDV